MSVIISTQPSWLSGSSVTPLWANCFIRNQTRREYIFIGRAHITGTEYLFFSLNWDRYCYAHLNGNWRIDIDINRRKQNGHIREYRHVYSTGQDYVARATSRPQDRLQLNSTHKLGPPTLPGVRVDGSHISCVAYDPPLARTFRTRMLTIVAGLLVYSADEIVFRFTGTI